VVRRVLEHEARVLKGLVLGLGSRAAEKMHDGSDLRDVTTARDPS
jgi:hypothetical protein